MAIVQCVQMGKDLGLDEHFLDHKAGKSCESSPAECLMKARIWQTIFICELMIGSPQGMCGLGLQQDTGKSSLTVQKQDDWTCPSRKSQ